MSNRVRVWDLPTRIFHWLLAFCLLASITTAYLPGAWVDWHARTGYAVLALLLFRIAWGFVGGRWSRFASFTYSPGSMFDYVRGKAHPDHLIGHNPLGAASVFAMLGFLLAQVASGLVSDDEIAFTGPLNRFVTSANGLIATWYHKDVGQWIIAGLVGLHMLTVFYYLWRKKDNLIKPMIDGDKTIGSPARPSRDDTASRSVALAIFLACVALVWRLVTLTG